MGLCNFHFLSLSAGLCLDQYLSGLVNAPQSAYVNSERSRVYSNFRKSVNLWCTPFPRILSAVLSSSVLCKCSLDT